MIIYFVSTYTCRANQTNALHDRDGKLIENGTDFCDCLNSECSGCHFPCPKCSSPKCSVDCRRNRKWTCDAIDIEGAEKSITLDSTLKLHQQKVSDQLVANAAAKAKNDVIFI